MKRFVVALAALFLGWSPAHAAGDLAGDSGGSLVSYMLDNGLEVVLAPDRRAPKVVMNLRYRVGSLNEPAGRSGFAHLFEHLMFSGTEAWPSVFGAHSAVGNVINAWTMEDGTVYYVEGLSANLPLILSIEADRMANLGRNVDQRELDLQRSVVKNEMRQNVLDRAGASGLEAFWSGLFPKPHPYSRTVIGSIADLDSATLDDVRGFFNTYYVPNNAVLVLTGDIAIDDAKALVAQTFGLVPRAADVPRPQPADIVQAATRLEFVDKVPSPTVMVGFAGPAADSADNGPLSIAALLLGDQEFGELRGRLVGKGLATSASASWTPGLLGGRFVLEASAAPGVTAGQIEAELKAVLADFAAAAPDPADVQRARANLLLSKRVANEALRTRTEAIAEYAVVFDKVEGALGDDPGLVGATPAEIERLSRSLLDPAKASVLVLDPGPRGGYPPVLTESSGAPEPFRVAGRPGVDIPKLDPREPGTAELPSAETATLSNGIRVVHYAMPAAPLAYLAATAKGGWGNAPQGEEGLLDMAANMAYRGAADRDYEAFAKASKDIGASVGYSSGQQATSVTLAVPPQDFGAGVALLADAVLKPRFDKAEWDISVAEVQDWLDRRESDLADVASRTASAALFPSADGAGPDWSAAALRQMTLEDARAAYERLFAPSTVTFYSVGPMALADVVASLEKSFGTWADPEPGYGPVEYPAAAFPGKQELVLVPAPGASQSALYVARPAPGFMEPLRSESTAVANLLGGHFTSRLNMVIREEKGYSYGVDGYLLAAMKKGGGLVIATTVERDTTGPALAEILKGFAGLDTVPVTDVEVARTVTAYRDALAGAAETSGGLFSSLVKAVGEGMTLEAEHELRRQKLGLAVPEVEKQAKALSALSDAVIVVVGDPEMVVPQLEAIGYADIEIADPVKGASGERSLSLGMVPQTSPRSALADRRRAAPAAKGDCGLDGCDAATALSVSSGRRENASSTREIHLCAGSDEDPAECRATSEGVVAPFGGRAVP